MTAIRAIIVDTWRQSLQQKVFVLMLSVMAMIVLAGIFGAEAMRPRLNSRMLTPHPSGASFLSLDVRGARGLAASDLDGDGFTDVTLLTEGSLEVWKGSAGGTFAQTPSVTLALEPAKRLGILAVSLDAAPGTELALYGSEGVRLYRLAGTALEAYGTGCPGPVSDLAAADLDGDGDQDLVCAGPAARVWFNAGGAKWEGGPTLGELKLVAAGDLDGDGRPDVIGARGETLLGWRGQGAELAAPETLTETRSPIWDLATAPLLGPEQPCVILTSRFERTDFFVRGSTRWASASVQAGNTPEVERIVVRDFSGDGLPDLALFSRRPGKSALWTTVLRGAPIPQFSSMTPLEDDASTLSDVYRNPSEAYPRVVGLEGSEGIEIPLHESGNPFWGPEDENWRKLYAESLLRLSGPTKEGRRLQVDKALEQAARVSNLSSPRQRHAQLLGIKVSKLLYSFSLIFFISACAGYFPGLLQEGGVDLVLARPVSRLQVYLGKFAGGLLLYSVASFAASAALVVGIGLRFGSYPVSILAMVPLQVFTAAVMFSMLAAIGVASRSTALPMLFGLFFFVAFDTCFGLLIEFQTFDRILGEGALGKTVEWAGVILPSFDKLKGASEAAAFGLNALALKPMLTSGAWLVAFLGLGYWRFRSTDY